VTFAEQVETLLSQARPEGFYRLTVTGMAAIVVNSRAHIGDNGPNTFVARSSESSLLSEPAQLLERLYVAADPEERRVFARILIGKLNRTNARVVARTLAATGQLHALHVPTNDDATSEELWRGLIHTMRYESPLFSEQDLQAVEDAARLRLGTIAEAERERAAQAQQSANMLPGSSMPRIVARVRYVVPGDPVVNEARAVIARIRYLRLAKTIREHQNPAIDADRQQLLSRLQIMGFSDTLSNASNEIEERLAIAATELDVKTVMDLARTFLEEFIEEACRKIEPKVGKPAPAGPKVNHYAPYREYLEAAGVVGREEGVVLQALYNFLSNQGTHKLGAAPEQLRVAHATVIEWCMLVAGRVKTLTGM
jgi:hypothetical protein